MFTGLGGYHSISRGGGAEVAYLSPTNYLFQPPQRRAENFITCWYRKVLEIDIYFMQTSFTMFNPRPLGVPIRFSISGEREWASMRVLSCRPCDSIIYVTLFIDQCPGIPPSHKSAVSAINRTDFHYSGVFPVLSLSPSSEDGYFEKENLSGCNRW